MITPKIIALQLMPYNKSNEAFNEAFIEPCTHLFSVLPPSRLRMTLFLSIMLLITSAIPGFLSPVRAGDIATARAYLAQAKARYEANDFLAAMELSDMLVSNFPDFQDGLDFRASLERDRLLISEKYTEMGVDAFKDDDFPKARGYFEKALKYNSDNTQARKYLREAITLYKEIVVSTGLNTFAGTAAASSVDVKQQPKTSQIITHYRLALGFLKDKQYDQAIREFEVVLKLDPKNTGAQQQLSKLSVDKKTYIPYQKGVSFFKAGKYAMAQSELSPIYQWNPEFLDIKFYLGATYYFRSNYETSMRLLYDFISRSHSKNLSALARLFLGCASFSKGQYERALYELTISRSLDPILFNRYSGAPFSDIASTTYKTAYMMTFRWILIMMGCQLVLFFMMHTTISRLMVLGSGKVLPKLLAQAKKYQQKGKLEKALKCLVQATAIDPRNHRIRFTMGMLLNSLGKISEAIDEFEAVAAMDSSSLKAHFNLALLYRKSGLYRNSLQALTRALDLDAKVMGTDGDMESILTNKILFEHTYTRLMNLLESKMSAQSMDDAGIS
ncbi:MAG: hypothetical protein CVV64_08520 [Candidatus Wallbacteria bacterium HGW-Wallbacteria-1]|jgi:tetratricopeptide (TPR) repeat protein|uniref:Tetratricopeptide repeat protein n=1 Tax=Candidatus Wallbacteria bacterium HGW-Wallbacteria-1 TaxID=2013854 RepID=A0A2N1PPY2_9BACT|nr:MAG: hypothetical protein CVV64_08520 [Candidatus Wallbacteria bacterium HGW-Wallbacteria-1]